MIVIVLSDISKFIKEYSTLFRRRGKKFKALDNSNIPFCIHISEQLTRINIYISNCELPNDELHGYKTLYLSIVSFRFISVELHKDRCCRP